MQGPEVMLNNTGLRRHTYRIEKVSTCWIEWIIVAKNFNIHYNGNFDGNKIYTPFNCFQELHKFETASKRMFETSFVSYVSMEAFHFFVIFRKSYPNKCSELKVILMNIIAPDSSVTGKLCMMRLHFLCTWFLCTF